MPIRVQRFPEFGVSAIVHSGALTPEELIRFIDRLAPADAAGRWIVYLDPSVDLSGVDVSNLPAVKRAVAVKLRELHGEARVRAAMVSASPVNEAFKTFWSSYVDRDPEFPAEVTAFPTLEAACEGLGLPEAARRAVIEEVEARDGRLAGRPPEIGERPVGLR